MDTFLRRLIKGDKNTTKLINNTDEVMEIREFRGIFRGENNFFSKITVKASEQTDIDATQYGWDDRQGGQPSYLMIFCGGSYLRLSKGVNLLLSGEQFISSKSMTIDPPEGQNSTGVVNYEVKFQQRDASVRVNSLKVFRDIVLLSNTHPPMGVMDSVPCLIKGDKNKGNKNTTRLINNTDEVMEIREFDGIISGKNNLISAITVKARQHIDIVSIKYGGDDSRGGQPCSLKIFCNGSYLRSSKGVDLLLSGEQFISFKSITIDPPEGQNSTGVVNYEVKFQQRDASVRDNSLKVVRDLVLDHDNGWSMQHCESGSVKLTYRKGMTMTLDPSKLFATVVDPAETSLLRMVLKFWSRTFADLNCKDNLGRTVCVVNDLMCQVKSYNDDRSKVEVAKVVEKVRVLNELCAAKVEWYHPLFPGMEDRFPPVVEMMAEVDQEKLKKFAATIKPLLQPPNSLRYLMIFRDGSLLRLSEQDLLLRGEEFISFKTVTIDQPEDQNSTGVVNYEVKFQQRDASVRDNSLKKWATRKGYSLGEERPFEVRRLSMDEKFDPRLQLIHMSQFARSSPRALALSDGGEIVRPTALSSSEFAATNNKAHLVGQDQSGSAASHYRCKNTRETSDKQGLEVLQQHFGCKHKHALKSLGVSGSMFKSTCRQHWFYWWQGRFENNDSLAWKSFEVLDSLPLGEQSNSIRHLARRRTLTHKHCVRLNKSQELPRSMLRDYSGGLAAQFDIGLPDGGHILSLSEKKIVRKTLKRKCRTMSVLSLEDHQQHVGRRWEDTVKFLGAKRIYRQLGIHRETTAKRIRGQLGTRWSFKQFAIPILQTAIGLPDGGHILSLSEKKIVRKTSTRKCRSMSVLSLEDHKQHVDRRWEDVVKSHGAKRICRQLVIHRLSTAKRIHKQHGIHWWPFQRSAVGLPNGGHILPLSEKKIVGKTLKRKCRSTSVLSLVDRQQHVDRRWEDAAKNIGAKRICRQLVIHHVSIAKRRQHGIHHRWPFQQDWATMKGYSLGDGRPVEVIRLSTHAKLVSRLQLIYISWLGRFSPRPSALAGGGEVGRPLALSLSEFAATKNIAQRVGQGQSGSAASDSENERTREQEDLEEIHASSTSDDLRQLFRRMNRKDAAASLGVSESTFKRRCRKCGIKRWPEVRKRKVGKPPDQHGDGNTSTARNTPSQYVQTRMGGELVGQNHEANVFRDFTEGPPALNTENGLKGSSSEWASQMKDQSTLSTPYPNHNALVFPQPHSMLSENRGGSIDWWNSFASQAEPFSDRHISGSSNLAFPTWSDQAAPSQHVEGQSMQSTVYPDHNAVHRFPEGHVCESINWNEHTNSLASQIPNPNVVPLEPQIASTQMLSENMGSLDNWAELVSLEEEPSLGGHVSGSVNLTVTTCCDPSPSQQPMPTNHDMMPTAHVMSHLVARKDLSSVTLKVSYGDKTIKFQVPLTSKIVEVKEEVKKRLKLEPSNFDFEYKDEDDGDWIFLGCDEDLTNHLQLFSNQVIRLLVVDSDASTKNICESCGSLKRKRQ